MARLQLLHAVDHRRHSPDYPLGIHGAASDERVGTIPRVRPGTWILIVEDDDDIRRFFAGILAAEGYLVDEVTTAEEGLEHLRENDYDLILTDYALPHHTGAWMLQRARREGLLHARAYMVTGHPHPRTVPGVVILHKPVDIDMFIARVHQALQPVS